MFNEKILIVEDDSQIRNFVSYTLKAEGFRTLEAENGKEAIRLAASETVDMVLLDLGLPDVDGMEVLAKIREWSEMPVLIVSARDQDKEKVNALDLGADDYLTKPFSATELLARIRVALRHYYKMNKTEMKEEYQVKDLIIDLDKHVVSLKGTEIHVTPMEYDLLVLFMKNAGKVLTTKYILKEIYGVSYGTDTQALRALMAGLRRKIEKSPAMPEYIVTEIGVGYRMLND